MANEDAAVVVHAGWLAGEGVPCGIGRGEEDVGRRGPGMVPDAWVERDAGSAGESESRGGSVGGGRRADGGTDAIAAGIGARLERARTERGLSQHGLARLIGVERPTVCRWERGLRIPSIPALLRVAAALAVPPSALLPDGPDGNHAAVDDGMDWAAR